LYSEQLCMVVHMIFEFISACLCNNHIVLYIYIYIYSYIFFCNPTRWLYTLVHLQGCNLAKSSGWVPCQLIITKLQAVVHTMGKSYSTRLPEKASETKLDGGGHWNLNFKDLNNALPQNGANPSQRPSRNTRFPSSATVPPGSNGVTARSFNTCFTIEFV